MLLHRVLHHLNPGQVVHAHRQVDPLEVVQTVRALEGHARVDHDRQVDARVDHDRQVGVLVVRVQTAVRLAIATLFPTVKGAHVVLVQPMALQAIDQHDVMTTDRRVRVAMMTDRRVRVAMTTDEVRVAMTIDRVNDVMTTDQRARVVMIVEMTDHVRVAKTTDRRVRVAMMTDEVHVAMTTDQ